MWPTTARRLRPSSSARCRRCNMPASQTASVAFSGVEEQREDSGEFSGVARDVRGADIAAADGADVRAAERFHDEQSEGDRAEKVGVTAG